MQVQAAGLQVLGTDDLTQAAEWLRRSSAKCLAPELAMEVMRSEPYP